MRRLAASLVTAMTAWLLLASLTGPAWGTPPVHDHFMTDPFEGVIAQCDGFDVVNRSEGTLVRLTLYLDRAGEPKRVAGHSTIEETFTNSHTGRTVMGTARWNFQLVFQEPLERFTGVQYHVVVPGVGSVLIDAGRVVYDAVGEVVHESGKHQVLDGDFEDLCRALA